VGFRVVVQDDAWTVRAGLGLGTLFDDPHVLNGALIVFLNQIACANANRA
jgi:hypothetical protein